MIILMISPLCQKLPCKYLMTHDTIVIITHTNRDIRTIRDKRSLLYSFSYHWNSIYGHMDTGYSATYS